VRLARQIQRGLVGHLRRQYPGVVDLGVKRGPFYVLVGAYMPCVLVETAFVSHPVEGRRLARGAYRRDVAQGLYDGIARYLRDGTRRRTL
jgi:N-acetylmuramoyl-L-alanine amidase